MDCLNLLLFLLLINGNINFNNLNDKEIINPTKQNVVKIINQRDLKSEINALAIGVLYGLAASFAAESIQKYLKNNMPGIETFLSLASGMTTIRLSLQMRKDLKYHDAFYTYVSYIALLGSGFWKKVFKFLSNEKKEKVETLIKNAKQTLKNPNKSEEEMLELIERLSKVDN